MPASEDCGGLREVACAEGVPESWQHELYQLLVSEGLGLSASESGS